MPRRPTLDPLLDNIVFCIRCRKPMNGRGFHGAECQCGVKTGHAAEKAHSTVGVKAG